MKRITISLVALRHYIASITIATMLMTATASYAEILGTTATVRPDNSLIVDIQVSTGPTVAKLLVTYQTAGVDPLVSRLTASATTGPTAITIGRLRANRTYTYTVRGIDDHGGPSGTAQGSFTTGQLHFRPRNRQSSMVRNHVKGAPFSYILASMRTIMLLIAIATGFGILAVAQDDAQYKAWMKSVPASVGAIRKAADSAAAAPDANTLADTFDKVAEFWKARNAPDAVQFAETARDTAKAIAAGNGDKAANLQKLQTQCGGCHKAHREGAAPNFTIK